MPYIEGQFPQDVSLEDSFFTCANEKIYYNDNKSIAVYVKESVIYENILININFNL